MRIKQFGDPILRKVSQPISQQDIHSDHIQSTLQTMKNVLNGIKAISDENGNALSAPQVGHLVRMVLLRLDGQFVPMLNPSIKALNEGEFEFEEECFSFYNLRAKVSRASKVEVNYCDEHGKAHCIVLEGEAAGLIQHEIDHLDGVLFLDRVKNTSSLVSIDYLLQNNQPRLQQVKSMIDYMTSD
ncbi:peptide deformylase [Aliiglaciecola sp. M165]|uniref:peptide deformylase n=1 Tax=Aliiglaciecola sp. M165 TaxID=2593649 RepID=UPI00118056D2|nr:peptide deformylase [Aliiglaciecola sp. M165]TRY30607.1 hypothetical protein FM019_11970 [Aliiglaciecola sp. M165]